MKTNRVRSLCFVVWAVAGMGFSATANEKCRFNLVSESSKVDFIAYKTTQKTGVTGGFKELRMETLKNAKSMDELLESTRFSINALSMDSGNEARNLNLKDHFFKKIAGFEKISGKVKKATDGAVEFELDLNHVKRSVHLDYVVTPVPNSKELGIEMKGSIDILDFRLANALRSLNQVCLDLHKGADGVSKTWSTVDLAVKARIEKDCD